MSWFIFSEVMFFAAFFGALLYARNFAVPGWAAKAPKASPANICGRIFRRRGRLFTIRIRRASRIPVRPMAAPSIRQRAWATCHSGTLSSCFSSRFANGSLRAQRCQSEASAARCSSGSLVTVLLGVLFLALQGIEYHHAYTELGLTLASGIYGSTFFILDRIPRFPRDARCVHLLMQFFARFAATSSQMISLVWKRPRGTGTSSTWSGRACSLRLRAIAAARGERPYQGACNASSPVASP